MEVNGSGFVNPEDPHLCGPRCFGVRRLKSLAGACAGGYARSFASTCNLDTHEVVLGPGGDREDLGPWMCMHRRVCEIMRDQRSESGRHGPVMVRGDMRRFDM
jgi:hypothetical protein